MKYSLETIQEIVKQNEILLKNEMDNLRTELRSLLAELHKLEPTLNTLHPILDTLKIPYMTNKHSQEYNKIFYKLLGDGKTLCYELLTSFHYISLRYEIKTGHWRFGNLDLLDGGKKERLKKEIELIKKYIADFPLFINRLEEEIERKVQTLTN